MATRWRRTALRWLRRLAVALIVLIILPPALTVFYRAEFVHPWSTLMLRDMATLQHWERDWVDFE